MSDQNAAVVEVNPLSHEITAQIATKLVESKEINYNFRTDKQSGEKRPTFKMGVPLLTVAGVIAALSAGDKTTELVVEAVNDVIINRLRGLIGEKIESDGKIELSADIFDINDLSLFKIANLPKGERGAGISKEAWGEFVADYKAVMASPAAIALFPDKKARSPEVLEKHGILLAGKFNQIRSRKDTAQQMLSFLDIWAQVTQNAEDHIACFDLLRAKGETIVKGEDFNDL